jgi:cytoskeletal protein RodZ
VTIGEALTAARTKAGMSVAQVSELTRVRQTLVRQIEADDYSQCGGDFYARGHIRSIAHAIGIDPEPLIAEFDAAHLRSQAPRPAQVFESEAVRAERRGPNWSAAMAVALAVVCVWGLITLFSPHSHRDRAPLAGATNGPAPSASTTPSPTPSVSESTSPPAIVAQVPADGVTVALTAVSGSSWVYATDPDGHTLYDALLRRGESQELTDKQQIKLVLGNPSAVRLVVNGKDLGVPSTRNRVLHLHFGPGDPTAAG